MSMYGSHPSLHEPPRSMPAMRSTPDAGRRPTPQDYDPWTSYENEGYSFWPCQYRLTQARGPQETVLAEDEVPFHDELGSRSLGSVRFPSLLRGFGTRSCLRLLVKMNLKINRIAGDMVLMTQNLFQSNQRHTVRCITTAYSFGEKTMQMSEVQHASFSGNRYVYSFTLANDWLKSFLQSLREGVGSAEIQSLKNITIIQEFSVDDSPDSQSAPQSLLQVMYEFGVGDGELETYKLSTDSPAMDTPMMLAPTITTTNASLTTPSSVTGHTRARASTWDSSGPYRFRNGVDYGSSSPSLWGGDTHLHPPHEHSSSRPHHPSQYPPPSYERHSQHLYPPSQQHQQPRHQYQRHHRGIGGSVHGSFSQYGTSLPLPPNLGMKRSSVEGGRDEDVYYPLPDRTKDKRVCTTYARPSPAPLYQ
ncbi:hypothetical protein BGW38_000648 [Lunasporangiospora selenospora]|uniref:Uncharacterized protein n=1 Tax=Lunasporangiospora selenospora TaxID=979761 RepID=A0A9P6KEP2_9FUNG|nr:hypothetical protein BGW38_000648 [Lunasporangiospora selenospora]